MDEISGLRTFFNLCYGTRSSGYVALWFLNPDDRKDFKEEFYEWPTQVDQMCRSVNSSKLAYNVYFCPQILETRKRKKETVKLCTNIWADLDACPPDKMLVQPSIILESSPGRFQALWCLDESMEPTEAESIAMKIAYFHASHGADRSGWDLTQLLRVPGTYNFKYSLSIQDAPTVEIRLASKSKYRASDFAAYPDVKNTKELMLPLPEVLPVDVEPNDLMQRYRMKMNSNAFGTFSNAPTDDWSKTLWRLLMYMFEAGMTREEVYYVAQHAACNKYARDNKPPSYLWRDVCRAWLRNKENVNSVVTASEQVDLLSDVELADVSTDKTFVEDYIEWASGLGDAATQYHQVGAFTLLSTVMSGNVRIPTSFGTIIPNLWFMILGDTTLTRKSTAMDLATEMLFEIDEDYLLATDGSIEGLMTGLSMRPGQPSIFVRDEFSGLLEAITKKDYYAGMAETLTKLYDGKPMKRILRKEVITVQRPILIILAGGIKNKVQSLLTFEDVSSGFIPRFCFVTAESVVSRVQPLGPPTVKDLGKRDVIMNRVRDLKDHYDQQIIQDVKATGGKVASAKQFDAMLTEDAWARYGKLEKELLHASTITDKPELMVPLYSRLTISTLKAATLIAASRQRDERVVVEEEDIVRAIRYSNEWRGYANEVVNGIGKNAMERDLDRILGAIVKNPGVSRSRLMQNYHLTARGADAVFSTLEQRGLITMQRVGTGGQIYYPIVGGS